MLVTSDNITTVAYFNRQGETQSMMLMDLTFVLFDVVLSLGVTLRAHHTHGRLNRSADLLAQSRRIVNTKWTLHLRVTALLRMVWGRPMLDHDGHGADDTSTGVRQPVPGSAGLRRRRHVLHVDRHGRVGLSTVGKVRSEVLKSCSP